MQKISKPECLTAMVKITMKVMEKLCNFLYQIKKYFELSQVDYEKVLFPVEYTGKKNISAFPIPHILKPTFSNFLKS